MGAAASAPVINDVTTNPSDPPVFLKSRHSAELSDDVKNVRTCVAWSRLHAARRRQRR